MSTCITRAILAEAETLSVSRQAAGALTLGRWVPAAPSTISIEGEVQPMTPEEILREVDSRHVRAAIKVYTITELLTVNESAQTQPDIITWNSEPYEVFSVADWDDFYKVIAVRREI